jgi:VIT1/CCC1 family predicted Fe2+/Mn2+ transporter
LSAIGSHQQSSTVIILALASLFADGVSMGVSAYESEIYNTQKALNRGITTFLAFITIGCIPIIMYNIYKNDTYSRKLYITILSVLSCLFLIGIYKALLNNSNIFLSGLKTSGIGIIAGSIAYYLGNYLEHNIN